MDKINLLVMIQLNLIKNTMKIELPITPVGTKKNKKKKIFKFKIKINQFFKTIILMK